MNSSSPAMLVVSLTTVHASPASLSFCGAMAAVGCSPLPARYTSPSALKPRYGSWRMAALTRLWTMRNIATGSIPGLITSSARTFAYGPAPAPTSEASSPSAVAYAISMPFSCTTGTKPLDWMTAREPGCVSLSVLRQASNTTKCVASLELACDFGELHRLVPQLAGLGRLHVYRNEVVGAGVRRTVAGVIKEGHGIRTCCLHAARVGIDGLVQDREPSVTHRHHIEAKAFERRFQQSNVVVGIGKGADATAVALVADEQRHTLLGQRGRRKQHQHEEDDDTPHRHALPSTNPRPVYENGPDQASGSRPAWLPSAWCPPAPAPAPF